MMAVPTHGPTMGEVNEGGCEAERGSAMMALPFKSITMMAPQASEKGSPVSMRSSPCGVHPWMMTGVRWGHTHAMDAV